MQLHAQLDVVSVRLPGDPFAGACMKPSSRDPPPRSTRASSCTTRGSSAAGVWMIEYQENRPSNCSSAKGSAASSASWICRVGTGRAPSFPEPDPRR
jgi:hypothetical protein